MPYEGEFAQYQSLKRLAESRRVHELLSTYRVHERDSQEDLLTLLSPILVPTSNWSPDWILAIDGSYATVPVKTGFPGAEAGYLTIASVLLNIAKIRQLDESRPVDPKLFKKTQDVGSIDWALPGCNVVFEGETSPKESFRHAIYDLFKSHSVSPSGETLLDTYETLLESKPLDREQHCPYDDCHLSYLRKKGTYACGCEKKRTLYSTDALRFHERLSATGSNGAIFGEVMQVLERTWAIHIIRMMLHERWHTALRKMAIIIDGPLAVFGQPAWISQAIIQELYRLNQEIKQVNHGQDLLLLGIMKSGEFVDHLINIDTGKDGKHNAFPAGYVALLTDEYVKDHIVLSKGGKPHGEDTYFGRVFYYKTSSNKLIVGMLPFLAENHRNRLTATTDQYPRISDALNLLDQIVSSRFPNSVAPLIAANAEAAIPLHLGKKVLQRIARDAMQEGQL